MLNAALMSALAQSALILGAVLVWRFAALTRATTVGGLMAFGAGAVISAVTIDLVAVAYEEAGAGPTSVGIAIGCLGYYAIIQLLERRGESEKPSSEVIKVADAAEHGEVPAATATEARNITIGMLIDGIPESIAIGLTMHMHAAGVSFALVASIFVASLPEAIGVAAALRSGGFTLTRVLLRLASIVIVCAIFGAVGFGVMSGADPAVIALIQSVAAGALLVVVVNEMVPIAIRGVKRRSGIIAAAGFVFSAIMTWLPELRG